MVKNTLFMILILPNFLRFVLWAKIWSILEYVPWALDKNVCSTVVGCSVLQMCIRFCWLKAFLSSISLLIFCLVVHSIVERGVLKSPTIIVDFFISPFSSICFCFILLCSFVVWCIYNTFRIALSS